MKKVKDEIFEWKNIPDNMNIIYMEEIEQLKNKYFKQKEVLDKIKEYLWNNTNFETVYHYDKDITVGKIRAELEEILEEIE